MDECKAREDQLIQQAANNEQNWRQMMMHAQKTADKREHDIMSKMKTMMDDTQANSSAKVKHIRKE